MLVCTSHVSSNPPPPAEPSTPGVMWLNRVPTPSLKSNWAFFHRVTW
jgi:hypothetical protein